MTRILLVRHGESTWNAEGRWQGQADPPLSDRGRQQAVDAAGALGAIDAIVTSDLARAAETAALLARALGVDHLATEPRLRERDAGPLSGLTRFEIHERYPGLLHDDPAGYRPGPDGHPLWPEGYESDATLWTRVAVALRAIGALVPDGDVLAVTHGGVVYAVERQLASSSDRAIGQPGPGRGRLANLEGSWVDVDGDTMVLGDRVALIAPDTTRAIEPDRI